MSPCWKIDLWINGVGFGFLLGIVVGYFLFYGKGIKK